MKPIRPCIVRCVVAVLLVVTSAAGCMSPAGGRSSVDQRSANINDQVEWIKSTGGSYGSHGAPAFNRSSGMRTVKSSAANN